MGRDSRSHEILVEIRKEGGIPAGSLVERLKVSPATVRREVATNTINVAMELSPRTDIRLFVTGGELSKRTL